jgi:hypothetical protein
MLTVVLFVAAVNLAIGFMVGYISRYQHEKVLINDNERSIYCDGYEDGFYFGLGEYDPEMFRKEIAEKAYHEYRGIKHGPTKH